VTWPFIALGTNYEDPGIRGRKKGGAIQVVAHDTQDLRRECRFHNLSGGVCVGAARLRVSRGIFGKIVMHQLVEAPADLFCKVVRYGMIIGLGSVLEAMSGQNDNIILPVYMWSMLAIGLLQ
jgi:hypothetical protein